MIELMQDAKGMFQCSKCGRYFYRDDLIRTQDKLYGKVLRERYACPSCKGIVVLVKDHHFTPNN
jgi:predicted RNA-binding Zn-ribbon protein involved in translation (DUF1610 family)